VQHDYFTGIGIKDLSNPTPILYIESSTVCGFFLSWQCMPTPNVRSDIWNCVESYVIHMFLACRLKITFTSNLKLIISFLVLHIVLLSLQKLLSLVDSTRQAPLTSRVYFRLADRPSASLHSQPAIPFQQCCWGIGSCHVSTLVIASSTLA
jgi:hypothetical protein